MPIHHAVPDVHPLEGLAADVPRKRSAGQILIAQVLGGLVGGMGGCVGDGTSTLRDFWVEETQHDNPFTFTRDLYKMLAAWDRLEVGGIVIGDVPSYRVDNMPYGGVKDSGLGREGVKFAMEDMTEIRNLVIRRR